MGYDPTLGRFLTRDTYPAYAPVPQTLHRYVYVKNNPVNHTDPVGLCTWFTEGCTPGQWFSDWHNDFSRRADDWGRDFYRRADDWSRDFERRASDWRGDVTRRLTDLRSDPVGSQLRGLRGSAESFADFSARKGAEVSIAWRTMLAADERGDLGGVIRGMGDVAANVTLVSDLQRTELGRVVLNGVVIVGAAYFTRGATQYAYPAKSAGPAAIPRNACAA